MKLTLTKVRNLKKESKKTAQPELDGITLDYPDLSVERRLRDTGTSSGQISCQSSGRKSLRDTAPAVAVSIGTHRETGTGRPAAH